MDAKNGEGENSSPLKETARIQFVHQRDIGIARASSHSSPLARSLRFSSAAPRKHIPPFDSFTALAPPHVNQCLGEGSRYTILIPSPLLPQSSEGSLSPRYNATPSNPIHRCFSHPHIAVLDQSTTSYWVTAPHCVSRKSHNHDS